MEPEWRTYLRENAPELYEAMIADVKWSLEWRDDHITFLIKLVERYERFIRNDHTRGTAEIIIGDANRKAKASCQ